MKTCNRRIASRDSFGKSKKQGLFYKKQRIILVKYLKRLHRFVHQMTCRRRARAMHPVRYRMNVSMQLKQIKQNVKIRIPIHANKQIEYILPALLLLLLLVDFGERGPPSRRGENRLSFIVW